jgi:hypothetical protein
VSTEKNPHLLALFPERVRAEEAYEELKRVGFPEEGLGLAATSTEALRGQADDPEHHLEHAADGAGMGALAGAALGGLATGTLAGALPGALLGVLVGVFVGMGVPEPEARHYERAFHQGTTFVAVEVGEREDEAKRILEKHGGEVKGPYGPP